MCPQGPLSGPRVPALLRAHLILEGTPLGRLGSLLWGGPGLGSRRRWTHHPVTGSSRPCWALGPLLGGAAPGRLLGGTFRAVTGSGVCPQLTGPGTSLSERGALKKAWPQAWWCWVGSRKSARSPPAPACGIQEASRRWRTHSPGLVVALSPGPATSQGAAPPLLPPHASPAQATSAAAGAPELHLPAPSPWKPLGGVVPAALGPLTGFH